MCALLVVVTVYGIKRTGGVGRPRHFSEIAEEPPGAAVEPA